MAWAKLDDKFDDDDETIEMSDNAIALHVCAMTYCSRMETDGFVSTARAKRLRGGRMGGIKELLQYRWWVEVDGGYQLRSFLKFNPSKAERNETRAETAKRKAEYDERRRNARRAALQTEPPTNGNSVTTNVTPSVSNSESNGSPVPSRPVPSPLIPVVPLPKTPKVSVNRQAGSTHDEAWERFCRAYPRRSGSLEKSKAEGIFRRVVGSTDPDLLIAKAEEYHRWADATGKTGTEMVKQMTTWLNGKLWLEIYELPMMPQVQNGAKQFRQPTEDELREMTA